MRHKVVEINTTGEPVGRSEASQSSFKAKILHHMQSKGSVGNC